MMNSVIVTSPTKKPEPLSSLVASARRIKNTDRHTGKQRTEVKKADWQEEAWDLYDMVGELRFLTTTVAGRLGQAHLYVGKQGEQGEERPERIEDAEINDLLLSIGGSRSAQSQILTRLAINLTVPGEGWLAGIPASDSFGNRPAAEDVDPMTLEWTMLSVSEVSSKTGSNEVTLNLDGTSVDFDPADIYLIRVWNPHPRKSWEADSPTRAAIPILKELVGLTMHISAQVDSRLAGAGLLIVPQSAQRAVRAAAGVDEDDDQDVFTEAMLDAMMTPIGDRSSASAVVPLVVTVPDDAADKFQHISFSTNLDAEARNLRDESIRRMAMSLDAPPELLLGTSGMNHWGGWLVQEETVTSHIEPPLALICDALTTQYLWPALEARGYEDFEDYVVWYDVDHLIIRPTVGQDALNLHERNALSDTALRRIHGFDESDAPEDMSEDPAVGIVLEMVQAAPALLSSPGIGPMLASIRGLLKGEEVEPIEGAEDVEIVPEEPEEEPEAVPGAPPRSIGEPDLGVQPP